MSKVTLLQSLVEYLCEGRSRYEVPLSVVTKDMEEMRETMDSCFTKGNTVVRNIKKVVKRKQMKRKRIEEDSDYSDSTVWMIRFGRNRGYDHNTLLNGGIGLIKKRTDVLDIINHCGEEEHGANYADKLDMTLFSQPNLSKSPQKV